MSKNFKKCFVKYATVFISELSYKMLCQWMHGSIEISEGGLKNLILEAIYRTQLVCQVN